MSVIFSPTIGAAAIRTVPPMRGRRTAAPERLVRYTASSLPSVRAPGTEVHRDSRVGRAAGAQMRESASARVGSRVAGQVDDQDAGRFADLINRAATKHGIDPTLVAAVTRAESGFNPRAVSHAGAKGLMQLMDGTARLLGVEDSFDPAANVEGGTRFLAEMMRRFKTPELALAAYNAGPGNVAKYGGVPPFKETQTYVGRVLDYQRQIQAS